jgi:hypothetical protein
VSPFAAFELRVRSLRFIASGRDDDGQTNSVLFDLSVWPSSVVPSQRNADGMTTDRRILFFFTYLSGRRVPFRGRDFGLVDDGQTNSDLFDLTVCLLMLTRV